MRAKDAVHLVERYLGHASIEACRGCILEVHGLSQAGVRVEVQEGLYLRCESFGAGEYGAGVVVDGVDIVSNQVVFDDESIEDIAVDDVGSKVLTCILQSYKAASEVVHVSPESEVLEDTFLAYVVVVTSPSYAYETGGGVFDFLLHFELLEHEISLFLLVVVVDIIRQRNDHQRNYDDTPDTKDEGDYSARERFGEVVTIADGRHGHDYPPKAVNVGVKSIRANDEADRSN